MKTIESNEMMIYDIRLSYIYSHLKWEKSFLRLLLPLPRYLASWKLKFSRRNPKENYMKRILSTKQSGTFEGEEMPR